MDLTTSDSLKVFAVLAVAMVFFGLIVFCGVYLFHHWYSSKTNRP